MCGFAGIIRQDIKAYPQKFGTILNEMTRIINHRGPDDSGIWIDQNAGVGLSHCRLAVLDLSVAGRQPMVSKNNRYCITYNGEVYNFKEIKKSLNNDYSLEWKGHSDTEVILAAVQEWGVEKTLKSLVGMFAFALWDIQERKLYLARDRMGEKPLYYGINNGSFLFGSDLKSFTVIPSWRPEIDRIALSKFVQYGYIPAPFSIYKGIKKLIPGSYLKIPIEDKPLYNENLPEPELYWSFLDSQKEFDGDEHDAIVTLEELLIQSVNLQQISDVPLGTFLSGGIDSSLVTALLQMQNNKPVKTFSIGFNENSFNEAHYAKKVASFLGTEHTEQYLDPDDILSVVPELSDIYSEPFSDVSQLPTLMVARLARKNVTVCLSGDGGDELFCGYSRYVKDTTRWNMINQVPLSVRFFISNIIEKTPISLMNILLAWGNLFRTADMHQGRLSASLKRFGKELSLTTFAQLYDFRISNIQEPLKIVQESEMINDFTADTVFDQFIYMMTRDTLSYLPNDILTKVDRAAMSTSLETRIPLLDHRVVEFASSLPVSIKMNYGNLKWPLKKILYKYIPPKLVERPKMGFGVPMGKWLRGPLREWAEELLNEQQLKEQNYLVTESVRKIWKEHLSGQFNHQGLLWSLLMFQSWRMRYKI